MRPLYSFSLHERGESDSKKGLELIRKALVALLLVLCSCRDGKGLIEGLGIHLALEKHTLSNGMALILIEDHTVPIVSYQTWYRVGSVDERPGITGISHLFEHMMFKGTPQYGPKRFFQELEAKGAEVNAFTTRDYTVYYENFIPTLLEKVVDMEADRMAHLVLNDEVLATEKAVVLEERRMRTDNAPEGRMQEALWQLAFRRHPYQWPVIGYPQDILSLSTEQVQQYFKNHYQPANAALVVVGDFQAQAVLKLIQAHYGAIEARARPKRDIADEPEQKEERRLILRDKVASERLSWAYHVTSALDDDSYSLDVLANILFEGTASRAYRRLVEEKDIAATVSGAAFTPAYPGLFIVACTLKGGVAAAEAEKLLESLIREVQDQDVSLDEIKAAVRQLTVQLVDSVRTPYGMGQLVGTVQSIFGDPERFAQDLGKYTQVTAADVRRVAQKYLYPNNRSVVTLVPDVVGALGVKK
ncbi:pitrilysin family protein [Bdellovibrionota bacterium FG-1]